MNSEYIKRITALWQDVVEGKKKKEMDPVGKADADIDNDGDVDSSDEYLHKRRKAIGKAMKKEETDQIDELSKKTLGSYVKKATKSAVGATRDIATGNKPDDAHRTSNKRAKGINTAVNKLTKEASDMDTKEVDKALSHDCAKHVTSEQWGFGECISGQHTLVENEDGTATVTHYDVMFEHGVEFDVPVEDLDILVSESHKHTAKKKMKESKQPNQSGSKAETMKDKRKGKGADDMAKDLDADNPNLEKDDAQGHEDATKAGRAVKGQAPARPGEKRMGDMKIINPVKGAVTSTTGKEG